MRKLPCLLNLLAGLCLCSDALANTNDASSFFLLGVEHIATGFDHLLFLLALILCGGSLVALFKIITAFTLAHSVTLAAAALGLVNLPSTLVESVIALSIAYVAFENLFPRYAISRRWTISFLFGLMHGFGFSSVLKEIGLPHDTLLWSLLNFNLGVETGQLLAVAIVLPGLLWLRTTRWEKPVVDTLSALVLVVGVALFVQRAGFSDGAADSDKKINLTSAQSGNLRMRTADMFGQVINADLKSGRKMRVTLNTGEEISGKPMGTYPDCVVDAGMKTHRLQAIG